MIYLKARKAPRKNITKRISSLLETGRAIRIRTKTVRKNPRKNCDDSTNSRLLR